MSPIAAAVPLPRPDPEPLPSGAETVLRLLATLEVTHLFGVPGGAVSPYLKLLRRSPSMTLVIGSHENGSAFMADGYARMSDRLGVVLVTSGPGATNALTGVACAHAAGTPLLLLSGQAATSRFHLGSIQESTNDGVNIVEIFRHVCGASELVPSAAALRNALVKAARLCLAHPGQAVHLSIPLDVSAAPIREAERLSDPSLRGHVPHFVDEDRMHHASVALAAAHRPFLLLGAGCRRALRRSPARRAALLAMADELGVPFATTAQAKGILPESHARSLGVYGLSGSPRARAYLAEGPPDVTLVVGSSLGEWTTRSWDPAIVPTGAFFQVDVDARRLGRSFPGITGIVGDAGAALDALLETAPRHASLELRARRRTRAALLDERTPRSAALAERDSGAAPIKPQRLMRELGALCDARTSLFIDSGNSMSWAIHHLVVDPPAELFVTTSVASMGWAVAAVVGAKLAAPDRACLCVTGDGSFLMHGAEVLTAARHHLGAVWIVLFDDVLGMVNQGEAVTEATNDATNDDTNDDTNDATNLDDAYYQLGDPDLVAHARSLGAEAVLVEDPAELAPALALAVRRADEQRRPHVVVVRIDRHELPPMLERFASLAAQTSGARS
jgi:acetolactate synthase I/II/III large subunit